MRRYIFFPIIFYAVQVYIGSTGNRDVAMTVTIQTSTNGGCNIAFICFASYCYIATVYRDRAVDISPYATTYTGTNSPIVVITFIKYNSAM